MSVKIVARPVRGIRRVGIHHPAEPVVFPDGFFTESELEVLKGDPDLIVDVAEDDDAGGGLSAADRAHLRVVDGDGRKNAGGQLGAEGSASEPGSEAVTDQTSDLTTDELPVDPEVTHARILLLSGETDEVPSVEEIAAWTPEERKAVGEYCIAVHIAARDNPDALVPEIPERLSVMFERQARARELRAEEEKKANKKNKKDK